MLFLADQISLCSIDRGCLRGRREEMKEGGREVNRPGNKKEVRLDGGFVQSEKLSIYR